MHILAFPRGCATMEGHDTSLQGNVVLCLYFTVCNGLQYCIHGICSIYSTYLHTGERSLRYLVRILVYFQVMPQWKMIATL